MTSETRMAYALRVARHGRSRRCAAYHESRAVAIRVGITGLYWRPRGAGHGRRKNAASTSASVREHQAVPLRHDRSDPPIAFHNSTGEGPQGLGPRRAVPAVQHRPRQQQVVGQQDPSPAKLGLDYIQSFGVGLLIDIKEDQVERAVGLPQSLNGFLDAELDRRLEAQGGKVGPGAAREAIVPNSVDHPTAAALDYGAGEPGRRVAIARPHLEDLAGADQPRHQITEVPAGRTDDGEACAPALRFHLGELPRPRRDETLQIPIQLF